MFGAIAYAAPHPWVGALGNWDGAWYGTIAKHGYSYRATWASNALWFYDRKWYALTGAAAACALATRVLGVALALGFTAAAILDRKRRAAITGVLGLTGIAAFALFCRLRFGDALAFVHAQTAWRHGVGFDAAGWQGVWRGASWGGEHDRIVIVLVALAIVVVPIFARRLGAPGTIYFALACAVLLLAGPPISIDRYMYSIVPVVVAIGAAFRRAPYAGYAIAAVCLVLLALDAMAFARFQWVA